MKLYAAADIHGSQYRLNIILNNIEKYSPDLVVICGDITQFGPGEVAKNFLNQIKVETIALHGNIDTPGVIESITESNAVNIDHKRIIKKGIPFVGIGGELTYKLSKILIKDNNSEKPLTDSIDKNTILVTHVPPYKTQDKVFFGHHSGNKELRQIIDEYKPRIVLCAHIHEDPGYTKLEESIVVNCSIGKRTEGAIIELNENIDVKILE
jgi:Icc-related predicted phosphoesterase